MYKGYAVRFLPGHMLKTRTRRPLPTPSACECGCGELVPVTDRQRYVKARFILGHQIRKGADHHAWKGGRSMQKGYVIVYRPDHPRAMANGHVYEHRLVMECVIGRPIASGEVVHHINEDKTDNRPENLQLVTRAEHLALHRRH